MTVDQHVVADPTGPTAAVRRITRTAGGAERNPAVHARRRRALELALGFGVPTALVVLWQIAAVNGWINRILYPAPSDIWSTTFDVFAERPGGHMWGDLWVSSRRVLWGYAFGVLGGLVLGFTMGVSRLLRAALEPMLNALYTVPKLALIGIFLLIFGFKDKPIIAVIAVTTFFFVWIQTMASVMAVSQSFIEAARSFGAHRRHLFRHVLLPAAMPMIFVGLRVAAGVAVLTLMGAEFVFTPDSKGIGYRINNARVIFDPPQAYVGLVIAALMGVVFTWVVQGIGRVLTPWAPKDHSAG